MQLNNSFALLLSFFTAVVACAHPRLQIRCSAPHKLKLKLKLKSALKEERSARSAERGARSAERGARSAERGARSAAPFFTK